MSKELKIGMAIGAVLLVVLIVYLAVPKPDTRLAQDTPAEETQAGSDEGIAPAAPAEEPAPGETPAVAGAEKAGVEPDIFAPGGEKPSVPAPTEQASAGDGTNWAKLLETGDLPAKSITPSLSASERVAPEGAPATPQNIAASSAPENGVGDAIANAEVPGTASDPIAVPEPSRRDRDLSDPAPAGASAARTHTVKSGENYSTIAKAVYGDARHYLAIQEANPTIDPARMKPGTVINLPDRDAVKAGSSSSTESTDSAEAATDKQVDTGAYRVQSGDSLYKIAIKRYGTSNMVDEIYELNKQAIGADSSRLKPGTVLKMPDAPKGETPAR